jgi:cyclopropane fatty-acyl-phospholipid synthase-like methyltransferase
MSSWRHFWEGPSPFPIATWDWQSQLFLRSSAEIFPLQPGDRVLDVGCGPGSLAAALPPGIHYTGLDISAASIVTARERLPDKTYFRFENLGDDYLDLTVAKPGPYSRLLALSVVQYYRDLYEVRSLLEGLRSLAAPGAMILIADLPMQSNQGAIRETWRTLCRAASLGATGRQIRFLARCALSSYRQARGKSGLLTWSRDDLDSLAEDLKRRWQAEVRILHTPLTVSVGRAHLWVRLPGAH